MLPLSSQRGTLYPPKNDNLTCGVDRAKGRAAPCAFGRLEVGALVRACGSGVSARKNSGLSGDEMQGPWLFVDTGARGLKLRKATILAWRLAHVRNLGKVTGDSSKGRASDGRQVVRLRHSARAELPRAGGELPAPRASCRPKKGRRLLFGALVALRVFFQRRGGGRFWFFFHRRRGEKPQLRQQQALHLLPGVFNLFPGQKVGGESQGKQPFDRGRGSRHLGREIISVDLYNPSVGMDEPLCHLPAGARPILSIRRA